MDSVHRTPMLDQKRLIKTHKTIQETASIIDYQMTNGVKKKWKISWKDQDADSDELVAQKKIDDDKIIREYEEATANRYIFAAETLLSMSSAREATHNFPTIIPKPGHPFCTSLE